MSTRDERQDKNGKKGLDRRKFLQASLAGAATVALPGAAAAQATQAAKSDPCKATPGKPPVTTTPCGCGPEAVVERPALDTTTAYETWNEPWVWRPDRWPGQQLDLQVVENQNPGITVGLGNPGSVLFSYGGDTPGPTIRMRGDETLLVKLRNHLGEDFGRTPIGPYPDPAALTPDMQCRIKQVDPADPSGPLLNPGGAGTIKDDFCLGEHTNGVHAAHVTNLHTHGLHVRPDRNPDGTHSDNVILRVMPQADLERREQNANEPTCNFLRKDTEIYFLRDDEQAGEADYEFRLGDVMGDPNQPHPPGTHWYHPHSHGATHNQVTSGMAGFLIVEGDVDEAVNEYFAKTPKPKPTEPTGPHAYRERLMFMQRVFPGIASAPGSGNLSDDPDANPLSPQLLKVAPKPLINGSNTPPVIVMRPGAVERWRVLNGSVDGRGFKRFMVVEGQYEEVTVDPTQPTGTRLYRIDAGDCETVDSKSCPQSDPQARSLLSQKLCRARCATYEELEAGKQRLVQLAMDGVTLVEGDPGSARYTVRDLAEQNAGTTNPLARPLGPDPNQGLLRNQEAVFRDAKSVRDTWVRPNEVFLGPANRTDVFFQAPLPADGEAKVYTVLAKAVEVHSDTPLANLQAAVASGQREQIYGPVNIVLAHVVVRGDAVEPVDVMGVRDALPAAPPYLQPISDDELRLSPEEERLWSKKRARDPNWYGPEPAAFRTRTIRYSGWGSADFPLVTVDEGFTSRNADLEHLTWALHSRFPGARQTPVLLSAATRSMAIDGRKFNPNDPQRPKVFVDVDPARNHLPTAEEWALFNQSSTLWGNNSAHKDGASDNPRSPDYRQPGYQYKGHYVSYPLTRREGQRIFHDETMDFQVVTKAVDHPFHIHQNPFWVMRVEIPDENGNLVNILDRPRWQDVVWIPRNGGRVVFRSRFPDFVGAWVNHCHILLHEDNGMMQTIQGTPFADEANYETKDRVTREGMSEREVNEIYPPPTPADSYRRNLVFVDPNPNTGQVYPGEGFTPRVPKLPEKP